MDTSKGHTPRIAHDTEEQVMIIEYAPSQHIIITSEKSLIGIDVGRVGKYNQLTIVNTLTGAEILRCKNERVFPWFHQPFIFFLDTSHPKLKSLLNVNLSLTFEGKKESSFTLANVYLKNLLDI